ICNHPTVELGQPSLSRFTSETSAMQPTPVVSQRVVVPTPQHHATVTPKRTIVPRRPAIVYLNPIITMSTPRVAVPPATSNTSTIVSTTHSMVNVGASTAGIFDPVPLPNALSSTPIVSSGIDKPIVSTTPKTVSPSTEHTFVPFTSETSAMQPTPVVSQRVVVPTPQHHATVTPKRTIVPRRLAIVYLNPIITMSTPRVAVPPATSNTSTIVSTTHSMVNVGASTAGIFDPVPLPNFQRRVLEELHHGHLGVVKMKAIARSFVVWTSIDRDIEDTAKNCIHCAEIKTDPHKAKVHYWEYPSKPWERIHIDFAGPMFGYMFLVIVDAHSKWLEVYPMKSTTTFKTIESLNP
ncbi:hypothetical protein JTE90_013147, partial [Oedothorax gibbosus]